jgi:DNA-binding NarL/FixJ family response regulator
MSVTEPVVRLLVVDDESLVRSGFRLILDSEPDLEVVGEASDGAEAIDLAPRLRPDVVLMDIRMPRLDGVEATARLTADGFKVLILTTFDLDEYLFSAVKAGASGFLLKAVPPDDLIAAVRAVARGDALVEPRMTRRLLDEFARSPAGNLAGGPAQPPGWDQLTEREIEVFHTMARGLSNAEIGAQLYISETTVKSHVAHVLMKLALRDRVQAVVLAYESGLISPGGA